MKALLLKGRLADSGQVEDNATAEIVYLSGPHIGHRANLYSWKHNCGGSTETVVCECGAMYSSGEEGCWAYGHQCSPTGDETLIACIVY
jgi:hypothetical protein